MDTTVLLQNGVAIPRVGLGVYALKEKTIPAIHTALAAGYRHLDTATRYQNEDQVGIAIAQSDVPRSDIFVTTKVWNDDQRQHRQRQAFEYSLRQLNLSYVDLYLIHWPIPGRIQETWQVLEQLYEEKLVRAIGVSNFEIHHLEELSRTAHIQPMVNQIEVHPKNTRKELLAHCQNQGIVCEAWSPLGSGTLVQHPLLMEIGEKYGKSAAQVMLRWDLQQGLVVIPRSSNPCRIAQNIDLYDFSLSEEDCRRIDALNENRYNEITGADPNHVTF